MRRAGVELVIWSSRLLLPVALAAHLAVVWSVAARGTFAWVATLLAPGLAEIVWLLRLDWQTESGHIVLAACGAVGSVVLLLGIGMVAMTERGSRGLAGP